MHAVIAGHRKPVLVAPSQDCVPSEETSVIPKAYNDTKSISKNRNIASSRCNHTRRCLLAYIPEPAHILTPYPVPPDTPPLSAPPLPLVPGSPLEMPKSPLPSAPCNRQTVSRHLRSYLVWLAMGFQQERLTVSFIERILWGLFEYVALRLGRRRNNGS